MSRLISIFIFLTVLLSACATVPATASIPTQTATSLPPTLTSTSTTLPTETPTNTPTETPSPTPTATPLPSVIVLETPRSLHDEIVSRVEADCQMEMMPVFDHYISSNDEIPSFQSFRKMLRDLGVMYPQCIGDYSPDCLVITYTDGRMGFPYCWYGFKGKIERQTIDLQIWYLNFRGEIATFWVKYPNP